MTPFWRAKIQKFRLSENKKKHFFYVERKKFRPKVNKRAINKIKYDFFAIILFFFMMVAHASQARNLFYPSARFSKLVSHPLLRYLYSRLCHMGQDLPAHDVIESYAALFTAMQGNAPQGPFVLVDVDTPSAEVAHTVYQLVLHGVGAYRPALPLLVDDNPQGGVGVATRDAEPHAELTVPVNRGLGQVEGQGVAAVPPLCSHMGVGVHEGAPVDTGCQQECCQGYCVYPNAHSSPFPFPSSLLPFFFFFFFFFFLSNRFRSS